MTARVRIPEATARTSTRDRVWYYYMRRDGDAQVVKKVEHLGGVTVPAHYVGPYATARDAANAAQARLEINAQWGKP
jgi:hypothetical protein